MGLGFGSGVGEGVGCGLGEGVGSGLGEGVGLGSGVAVGVGSGGGGGGGGGGGSIPSRYFASNQSQTMRDSLAPKEYPMRSVLAFCERYVIAYAFS